MNWLVNNFVSLLDAIDNLFNDTVTFDKKEAIKAKAAANHSASKLATTEECVNCEKQALANLTPFELFSIEMTRQSILQLRRENRVIAMKFFVDKGWTKEQAAGLVGNFMHESGMNPMQAQHNGGPAYGLAQWEDPRLQSLKNWAQIKKLDYNSLYTQLLFIQYELSGSESKAASYIKLTASIDESAFAVRKYYERPSVEADDSRKKYARQALQDYEYAYETELLGQPYNTLDFPYVTKNPLDQSFLNKYHGGSEECVPLVQKLSGAPASGTWLQGQPVLGNTDIPPGTAIATFINGVYPSNAGGNHAAIYLGQNESGIQVLEQFKGHPAQIRTIRLKNTEGAFVDQAENYSVIN